MSVKGTKTVASPLDWKTALSLVKKVEQDGKPMWALLLCCGFFTGLRIIDILLLKYEQITAESFTVQEQKTAKTRIISVNPFLREMATRLKGDKTGLIFVNKQGHIYSRQQCNRQLHAIAKKYGITTSFTTHSMRKTLGKRVYEVNGSSEKSLILLSDIFNHANIKTTKIYIGINEKNISDCYMNL